MRRKENLKKSGAHSPAMGTNTQESDMPHDHRVERSGFVHRLVEALHHSRRLQAAIVIRQYRHLVDPACGHRLQSDLEAARRLSVSEAPSPATKARFSLNARILIAAVVIAIGTFHVVGDAVLRGPSMAAKTTTVESNNYGD